MDRQTIIEAIRQSYRDRDDFDNYWQDDEGDGFISGQMDLAHVLLGQAPYDLVDSERLVAEIREGWV